VIAALASHAGQFSLAAEVLGCSRGMVRRHPRVAKAAQDAEARMTDIAVVQMHKWVLEKDYRACAYWLSSPLARARGFGPPSSTGDMGDRLRVNNFRITFVSPADVKAERAGNVIEHQAVEHSRAEDSLVFDDVTKPDDDTPDEAA
jgi:hypothetical protein